LNGFVAHKRCLKRAVPRFCDDVGKTISKLKRFNRDGFVLWLKKIKSVKEAEGVTLVLREELFKLSLRSRKQRKIEKVAKEIKRLAETYLFLEIPEIVP